MTKECGLQEEHDHSCHTERGSGTKTGREGTEREWKQDREGGDREGVEPRPGEREVGERERE